MSTRKKRSSRVLRSLCADVHPEDGVDPNARHPRGSEAARSHRKARQLCRQVAEALDQALASQSDDVLRDLHVVGVEPAPVTSRLLVTVSGPASPGSEPAEVLAHLDRASGRLRSDVAAAITRRRTPHLSFRLALFTRAGGPEGPS